VLLRLCGFGAIAAAILAACGGGSSADTEGAAGTTIAAPTTTTAPENALPTQLQGTWFLSTATAADPVRLYLRESSYLVSRGGSHSGDVEAEGDVFTFTSVCGGSNVEGTGRYRWTLDGDTLHLELIGKDECGGRSAVLEDATYERRG
jgi:hypothetical protein